MNRYTQLDEILRGHVFQQPQVN